MLIILLPGMPKAGQSREDIAEKQTSGSKVIAMETTGSNARMMMVNSSLVIIALISYLL